MAMNERELDQREFGAKHRVGCRSYSDWNWSDAGGNRGVDDYYGVVPV
jgi:hypothetical protein